MQISDYYRHQNGRLQTERFLQFRIQFGTIVHMQLEAVQHDRQPCVRVRQIFGNVFGYIRSPPAKYYVAVLDTHGIVETDEYDVTEHYFARQRAQIQ